MRAMVFILGGLMALGLVVSAPTQAVAWGKQGHLTVCDLAYRNLTETSRAAIVDLLQSEAGGIRVKGRGKLPNRHYTSFNIGCLEEDAMPRRHPDDHFINVSRDTNLIRNSCGTSPDCILSGIERDRQILADRSKTNEERAFALMGLGHWIGDIHQPLHISFADDRGGNGIVAKLAGKCGSSSYRVKELHGVWDNCLLEAGLFEKIRRAPGYKKPRSPNTITYRAVDALQAATPLSEEKTLVQGQPVDWANESYAITLQEGVLYCQMAGQVCRYSSTAEQLKKGGERRLQPIDQTYLATYAPVAEERVRRAGFRLAHILNQALDPAYTGPIQNSTQGP